jgi:hypothetical protein
MGKITQILISWMVFSFHCLAGIKPSQVYYAFSISKKSTIFYNLIFDNKKGEGLRPLL